MFKNYHAMFLLGFALLFVGACSQNEGSSPMALETDFASEKALADESGATPLGLDVPEGLDVSDIESANKLMAMAVTPLEKTVLCGGDHTVSARFLGGGDQATFPISEQAVVFTVTDGPNAGTMATITTDNMGYAIFTYNGAGGLGTDSIAVKAMNPKTGETFSDMITVTWMNSAPVLEALYVPLFVDQDNHKYMTITPEMVIVKAEDVFGNPVNPASVSVVSVSSDELEDHVGDGKTMDDILIQCPNTVMLRTERVGGDQGRVYTIHYRLTDANGSTADEKMRVVIVKDSSNTKIVSYHRDGGYSVSPECDGKDYIIQF